MPHLRLMEFGLLAEGGKARILVARPTLAASIKSRPAGATDDRPAEPAPDPAPAREGSRRRLPRAPYAAVGATPGGRPVPVLRSFRADRREARRQPRRAPAPAHRPGDRDLPVRGRDDAP